MPPSHRAGRATQSRLDDVDEFIEARQRRRARVAAADGARPERRRRDLMRAEFDWSDAPRRSRRRETAGLRSSDELDWGAGAGPGWTDEVLSELPAAARHDVHDADASLPVGGFAPTEDRWDDAPDLRAAPSAEVLTRAWDDALEGRLVETAIADRVDSVARADRPGEPAPTGYFEDSGPSPRRTVVITGRGGDLRLRSPRGYDARVPQHERSSFKPDRMAMWAVLLGLALLLAAATSSHAAVLHAVAHLH